MTMFHPTQFVEDLELEAYSDYNSNQFSTACASINHLRSSSIIIFFDFLPRLPCLPPSNAQQLQK